MSGESPVISALAGIIAAVWTSPFSGGEIPTLSADVIPPPIPVWSAEVIDPDGERVTTVLSSGDTGLNLENYPKNFLNAVISAEDSRYGNHPGIDVIGLASAIKDTLSGSPRGGSGIAQQLSKMRVVGDDLSMDRKLSEMIVALRIRQEYGDSEILRAYLSSAWFGRGMTGAGHAAEVWFGKEWADLSLAENVSIAALLKGPGYYDIEKNPERNRARRGHILNRMLEMGFISEDERDTAMKENVVASPVLRPEPGSDPWQVAMISRGASEAMRDAEPGIRENTTLTSTFSKEWQDALYEAVGEGPGDSAEIAMIAVEIPSGKILATIGGKDYQTSAYDRTAAVRQPGSSAKPLFFLGALEFGANPWDLTRNDSEEVRTRGWRPTNYDGRETSPAPLYKGLEASSNLMTLNMAASVGYDRVFDIAELSGAWDKGGIDRVAPSVLGATGTTIVKLTGGLAGIVNGGVKVVPHSISGPASPPSVFASAISSSYVTDMMAGVVKRGTASQAYANSEVSFVGKTGTSQAHRDAWFIGLTPSVAISVWIGRDDDRGMGSSTGGAVAAPYVVKAMNAAYEKGLIDTDGLAEGTLPMVAWPAVPLPADPLMFDPRNRDENAPFEVIPRTAEMVRLEEILVRDDYFSERDENADLIP